MPDQLHVWGKTWWQPVEEDVCVLCFARPGTEDAEAPCKGHWTERRNSPPNTLIPKGALTPDEILQLEALVGDVGLTTEQAYLLNRLLNGYATLTVVVKRTHRDLGGEEFNRLIAIPLEETDDDA